MYVTCYAAAYPLRQDANLLPMLRVHSSVDPEIESTYHELHRSARKSSGQSPAIGRVCDASAEYIFPNGMIGTTNYKHVTYNSRGLVSEFGIVAGTWAAYGYASGSDLRLYFFLDITGREATIRGSGTSRNPYWVDTDGYDCKKNNYLLHRDDPAFLDWSREQWISNLNASPYTTLGPTPSWSMGGPMVRDGIYASPGYDMGLYYDPTPKPSPYQLGESFSVLSGNVVYSPDITGPFGSYDIDHMIQYAKEDALANMPVDRINWAEKVISLFSTVVGVVGHAAEGASKATSKRLHEMAGDSWLSYRYVYSTETMDLAELQSVAKRATRLIMNGRDFICHGSYTQGGLTVKVHLKFSVAQFLDLSNPLMKLSRMWKYDAWDLVPFSFMIDWVAGIGDHLQREADNDIVIQCPPKEAWCSISYTHQAEGCDSTSFYSRSRLSLDTVQHSPDYFEYREAKSVKGTTIFKRTLDALAIGFGML